MRRSIINYVAAGLALAGCLATAGTAGAQTRQPSKASNLNYAFTQLLDSPEITDDAVTFRVLAPNAKRVCITGSWENFYTEQEMTLGEGGVWTYTMPKPAPDIYQYVFDIDGKVVLDPGNYSATRDMYNYRSNLIIRGEGTEPYFFQNSSEHGTLQKVWYDSKEFGGPRRMSVYVPYGFSDKQKYPVLYLQHGGGGDEEAWESLGRICEIMDYMIENGLCKPMIVVFPNGNASEMAACETALPEKFIFNMADPEFRTGSKYLKDLTGDIIPFVDSHYPVAADKAHRAVAGLSMGGGHTVTLMRTDPGLFDYYGVFSAGSMGASAKEALTSLKASGYKYLMVGCGPYDIAYDGAMGLVEALQAEQMPFTYYGEDLTSGHLWQTWRKCILRFLPHLF